MTLSRNLSVFLTSVYFGFRQALRQPTTALGQFAAYACIVVFYGYIFKSIPSSVLMRLGVSSAHLAWYPAATELSLFCFSAYAARQFQAVIQEGGYETSLLRPSSGWIPMVGEWYGIGLAALSYMAIPAFLLSWFVAGSLPNTPFFFIGIIVSVSLSGFCLCCLQFMIGASCMWLKQSEPVLWVTYKSAFLLGAMMWPLSFYPDWMAIWTWATPFPALLAVIGHWVLPLSLADQIAGVLAQIFWACFFVLMTAAVDRKILKRCQKAVAA